MNVLQELLGHAAQTLDTADRGSREAAMRIAHDLREVPARLGFARSAGQVYPIADLLIEAGGLIRHDAPDTARALFEVARTIDRRQQEALHLRNTGTDMEEFDAFYLSWLEDIEGQPFAFEFRCRVD